MTAGPIPTAGPLQHNCDLMPKIDINVGLGERPACEVESAAVRHAGGEAGLLRQGERGAHPVPAAPPPLITVGPVHLARIAEPHLFSHNPTGATRCRYTSNILTICERVNSSIIPDSIRRRPERCRPAWPPSARTAAMGQSEKKSQHQKCCR